MNKEPCIKAVRGYLNNKGLEYCEYETPTGSVYFHVSTNDYSNPCIRISNHNIPAIKQHTVTLNIVYTQFSKRAKPAVIRERIYKSLDNTFKKCKKYSLNCALKQI